MSPSKLKTALIVFAREPQDGKVKTRLLTDLSVQDVSALYKAFVCDVMAQGRGVECDQRFIFYAGRSGHTPFLNQFKDDFVLRRQTGTSLGARMSRALQYCYSRGFGRMVIVGTDCLTINADELTRVFNQLKRCDVVLGPSVDGGYYLIGLNYPYKELFTSIPWSTQQVSALTLRRAEQLGLTARVLARKQDIDTIRELKAFVKKMLQNESKKLARPWLAQYTRSAVKRIDCLCQK